MAELRPAETLQPRAPSGPASSARLETRRPSASDQVDESVTWHLPATLGALVLVAAYRTVVIGSTGEPGGLDFGNWLMLGHQALGEPLANAASVTYPPVVPALSVLIVSVLGVVWGTALFAGAASVMPALGVYASCRLLGIGWPAVPAAILVAAASSSGEAAAWGGVPQLLGLGLAAVVLALAQVTLENRSLRHAMLLAVSLFALAATTHLILAQAALAMAGLVAVNIAAEPARFGRGTWLGRDGWLTLAGVTLLPLAVLLPTYVQLTATVGQTFAGSPRESAESGIVSFARALSTVYRDLPVAWKPAIVVTMAMPVLLLTRRTRIRGLQSVVIALALSLWVVAVVSGHGRFVYLMPIAVALSMALWLSGAPSALRTPPWGPVMLLCATALVTIASVRGLALFPTQRAYYGSIQPPGTVAGLDWVRDNTARDALIAVAPVHGAPFGWWVQGYGRRAAMIGSEDRWLNIPQERSRAGDVVALLSSPNPLAAGVLSRAAELDIDYLLIPTAWGGLDPNELAEFRAKHPELIEFSNAAMVLVRIPSKGG